MERPKRAVKTHDRPKKLDNLTFLDLVEVPSGAMRYQALATTGVTASRIGLGCGGFLGVGSAPAFFGMGESEEQSRDLMDVAWETGITLFDTADACGGGRSESVIGGWLRSKGATVREFISRPIEGSLTRLGVERVDLDMIHQPDPATEIEETLQALSSVVRAGKVGAFGACNIEGWRLEESLRIRVAFRIIWRRSVNNKWRSLQVWTNWLGSRKRCGNSRSIGFG